jgi:hypothetical protein
LMLTGLIATLAGLVPQKREEGIDAKEKRAS